MANLFIACIGEFQERDDHERLSEEREFFSNSCWLGVYFWMLQDFSKLFFGAARLKKH